MRRERLGKACSLASLACSVALAACGGAASSAAPGAPPTPALVASPKGSRARIDVRDLASRPRLTLIGRDGDPSPAVVATVITDRGPIETTALAAVVEARLKAAGFDADTRVDRSAFRARLLTPSPARAAAFFGALAAAFARAITPGSPELSLVGKRLDALKRNPLDAPELLPVAGCTGALGIAGSEPVPDAASATFVRALEAARAAALVVGRTSIAAVGPEAFGLEVLRALERTEGFLAGAAAIDAWPAADAIGAYTTASLDRHSARVTIAVRVADPLAAAAAAERMGAEDAPLAARLRALPEPFHLVEVAGVARPRGGCVSAVIEASARPTGAPIEPAAALAAAMVREEITAELAGPSGPAVASRQILTATDPREAASRAGWWALAGTAPAAPERWAFALGVSAAGASPPGKPATIASGDAQRQRFQAELERLFEERAAPVAELRPAVERGQGELWLLLASPCGVAEEGEGDAGYSALAVLSALEASRAPGVTLEPWITADGIGVIARAPLRDEHEAPADLARRVADAAARALAVTPLSAEPITAARSTQLHLLERERGREGAALGAFAAALSPDHPSWLEPFGLFAKVASSGIEGIRLRRRALAEGPLRVAVLANADAAQAKAAASAVDRWLRPSPGPRACHAGAPAAPRPGRYEVHLPSEAPLAEALIGAPIPSPGAPQRDLSELTALALSGDGGLLAGALRPEIAATASARILGGSRAPALVIAVRAPEAGLATAVADVKLLLARLPQTLAEADLARALALAERREQDARADPRRRLADLWSGRKPGTPARPTLAALQAFTADALKEASLVVVEARP